MTENYIKPEDVSPEDAQKVLDFLNTVKSPKEIADAVEIPKERDVGEIVASHILNKRQELGEFTNLQQVADVWQVGPERFTEIVQTLSIRETGGMEETGGDEVEETGGNIVEDISFFREITSYTYSITTNQGSIHKWITFYDDTGQYHYLGTTDLPEIAYKPDITIHGTVVVSILHPEFPLYLDMLRNEKPLFIHAYRVSEVCSVEITTSSEPVGEEEARQTL